MRPLFSALALGLALSGAAFAQTPAPPSQPGSQPVGQGAAAGATQGQPSLITAQKLKSDLETAGFTDVKIIAEAFVVQAKTKDGNPVVMTIGPHSFSAFEAIRGPGSGSASGSTMDK